MPFVTGHKYYLRFEQVLDFEKIRFEIVDWLWNHPSDKPIEFEIPFLDVREAIHVDDNTGYRIENNTLAEVYSTGGTPSLGDNIVFNDTDTRRLHLAINGNN